jgi:ribosome biogenesis GTPase
LQKQSIFPILLILLIFLIRFSSFYIRGRHGLKWPTVGAKRSRKKNPRDKDLTSQYLSGAMNEDALESVQRLSGRDSSAQQRKMEKTALLRVAEESVTPNIDTLPVGEVIQVFSLFVDVESGGISWLCVFRKTFTKVHEPPIVGDRVRFRDTGMKDENGRPEAVIEALLPRQTVLTRADSFKAIVGQPIVANAQQMLIVTSLTEPRVKWGIIDRMIVAAQSGGLRPILCVNKFDLVKDDQEVLSSAQEAMKHYQTLGVTTLVTSATTGLGLDALRNVLREGTTVLAGQSGVGKSSLITAIEPKLDLRIGAISGYTGKGRHTTSSARRYRLSDGRDVIDTPGVKLFGLWGVSRENLLSYFPDVEAQTAPQWRAESYQRILESLRQ